MYNHPSVFLPQLLYKTDVYNLALVYHLPQELGNLTTAEPFNGHSMNIALGGVFYNNPIINTSVLNQEVFNTQLRQQQHPYTRPSNYRRDKRSAPATMQPSRNRYYRPNNNNNRRRARATLKDIPQYDNIWQFKRQLPSDLIASVTSNRIETNTNANELPLVYFSIDNKN